MRRSRSFHPTLGALETRITPAEIIPAPSADGPISPAPNASPLDPGPAPLLAPINGIFVPTDHVPTVIV